ncbi:Long-chain-alcohol O-fatty-acyltransferase [Bertholletia excelsa]
MESEIYDLDGEMSNFAKIWLLVFLSLTYCYVTAKFTHICFLRFLAFIPVICLFLILPLYLHSIHLGGTTAFFIAWLANFKILLLTFRRGPLVDHSLSLPQFVALGSFPIKTRQTPPPNTQNLRSPSSKNGHFKQHSDSMNGTQNLHNSSSTNGHFQKPQATTEEPVNYRVRDNSGSKSISRKSQKSLWTYAVKGLLVGVFVRVYEYSAQIHPKILLAIYCFHIYFMLEIMLATVAALARSTLGMELEPQFDKPYLSTSLQDFWGRRWNIMVTRILRPTVYDPVLNLASRVMGRKWAPLPAAFAKFVVSGIMHEIIFYYLGRVRPTWEVTWFFLLHGASLMVEIAIKKLVTGKCRLPRLLSTPLTVGFVMTTGFRLFFPQLLRFDAVDRAVHECDTLVAFVQRAASRLLRLEN